MNLTDAITTRQNFLSRILAGATVIDPLWTLPRLEKLQDGAVTDLQARRYIELVKAQQNKLEGATVEQQCRIVARIACENHLAIEYMQWITLPYNIYQDVPAAIKELKALVITQNTITGLQDWIKDLMELNEWRPMKKS
jgi:hypothetical protein